MSKVSKIVVVVLHGQYCVVNEMWLYKPHLKTWTILIYWQLRSSACLCFILLCLSMFLFFFWSFLDNFICCFFLLCKNTNIHDVGRDLRVSKAERTSAFLPAWILISGIVHQNPIWCNDMLLLCIYSQFYPNIFSLFPT